MTTETNDAGVESQNTESESVNAEHEVEQQEATAVEKPQESEQKAEKPADKGESPPKMVDIRALHEERNQRKELQRQLAEQQQMLAKVNSRLETLFNPPKQAPARDQDPVGYLDHQLAEVRQGQQQILERDQQREQQAQQQQFVQSLAHRVRAAEMAFAQSNPDYQEAIGHLARARAAELEVFGLSPEQIAHQVGEEQARAALEWAHRGMNPAQVAYQLARTRGYTPKQAQQQAQQAQQQASAEEKIAAQQKGTGAARSLGSGGGVPRGKLTAQAIAAMSDEDFAKLSESDWRAAMGE